MQGMKHIVECHCVLPQNRGKSVPIYHTFIVFSEIDDSDTVVPKFVQCNNCGIVHKVTDICRSEIAVGKEELKTISTIDDIRVGLPDDTCNLLDSYSCDLATWEHIDFIYLCKIVGGKIKNNNWMWFTKNDILKRQDQSYNLSTNKELTDELVDLCIQAFKVLEE